MNSIEFNSIEAIAAVNQFDGEYKLRVDAAEGACKKIFKDFKKRERTITRNKDQYVDDKVSERLFNLRESVRHSLKELVRGRGFLKEIEACRKELEKEAPRTEVQQLEQTLKEIEIRAIMRETWDDLQNNFQRRVEDGDPLVIDAIENAPVPFFVDPDILEAGKKRRLEVLKPVVAKKFKLLQEAQRTIEAYANAIMPIEAGDIDPIRDILAS